MHVSILIFSDVSGEILLRSSFTTPGSRQLCPQPPQRRPSPPPQAGVPTYPPTQAGDSRSRCHPLDSLGAGCRAGKGESEEVEEKKGGKELLIPSSPSACLFAFHCSGLRPALFIFAILCIYKKKMGQVFFCRNQSKGTIRMPAMPDFPLILVFQPTNWASDPGLVVQRLGPGGWLCPRGRVKELPGTRDCVL